MTFAPAKLNLCLLVGPVRPDGRHELASVMQPLAWGDEVRVAPAARDEVVCPDVEGPNLVTAALAELRAEGVAVPPLRVEVDKRIPVAAGLGGGSADAAAVLRLAAPDAPEELLLRVAARLGADVPAQVRPRRVLATGAGERLEPLPPAPAFGVVLLPSRERLSTAAVYAEGDRLGVPRRSLDAELAALRADPDAHLGVNDLEPAARSLCPEIDERLAALREAGAAHAFVAGSGPTVAGLFATSEDAALAAASLAHLASAPIATGSADPSEA